MSIDYIDELRIEAAALLSAAETHPDAPIAACPGWNVAGLIQHVGTIYSGVGHLVRTRAETFDPTGFGIEPPDSDGLATWFEDRTIQLLSDLESVDAGEPVWTWGSDKTGSFYRRRMAHETTVHRWDAEAAVEQPSPIDAALAVDGIDELIEVGMQSRTGGQKAVDLAGTLHLHQTDGEGEWLLRASGGQVVATREHAKGDAAVRGTASSILLFLWGRSVDDLDIFGDPDVAHAWAALAP